MSEKIKSYTDSPNILFSDILSVANSTVDFRLSLRRISNIFAQAFDCASVRIGFDGEWFCCDDFFVTDNSRRLVLKLNSGSCLQFEFFFARGGESARFLECINNGDMDVAQNLVAGIMTQVILDKVSFDHRERQKELAGINRATRLLEAVPTIEDSLQEMCSFLPEAWQYPEYTVIRINYEGKVFASADFLETPWRMTEVFYLPDDRRGSIDVFYTREFPTADEGPFLKEERNLLINIANIIAGSASKQIYNRLQVKTSERLKELSAINRVSSIIGKELPLKETLQKIAYTLPHSLQHSQFACARLVFESREYRSDGFVETEWFLKENFVTLNNKNGYIQVCYTQEFPVAYDGPFLKEECQLLANLARLVCGFINNFKGRELLNKSVKTANTAVSEDFRKAMTRRDKQPLQLFFNKQILDRYIYLDMMKYKIKNILFVATLYDAFTLENDDSFFEQFMGEIYQYSLFSLPRITGVTSASEALELMESTRFDLAILMVGLDTQITLDLSCDIKNRQRDLPVYLLLNKNNNIKYFEQKAAEMPSIDKLFVWNGNSQILFSIVKSIEDNANVENDTKVGLVRVILLIEDSPYYYSKYLQFLFSIVFGQVQQLLNEEERNEINKISKMRSRPKVLHARNYEDAMYVYEKYKDNLLCVISDVEFDKAGKLDNQAGFSFVKYVRGQMPALPIIIQSAELSNKQIAESLGVSFINKDSENLQTELKNFLTNQLGFGDFVFYGHSGKPLAIVRSLREFETVLRNIPAEFLEINTSENQCSLWLMSRGEIQLAKTINPIHIADYENFEIFRKDIIDIIEHYREEKRRGKIVDLEAVRCPDEKNVISLAPGSLGGKGRGLAFISMLINNLDNSSFAQEINLRIPVTAIVGTDEFDAFISRNHLSDIIFDPDISYTDLRTRFAESRLSDGLMQRLAKFLQHIKSPLAVRSSSLSEDSVNQPFAGVFDTYIVPNNLSAAENLEKLSMAIKMVYASIYSESSRTYFTTIRHNIEDEKMAVVLQALVGSEHDGYYYPHISGTSQSYNYYPVAHMKPDEGFAVAAVGLGYYVVGGQKSFRFSPVYPNVDIMSVNDMVKGTQVEFYAVDLNRKDIDYLRDGENAPLATLDISEAEKHGTLKHCASVYNPQNDTLDAGLSSYGPRVVNFADILKYDYIPLPTLISKLLNVCKEALGSPVELEWAVDLEPAANGLPSFYLLQIKPIVTELSGSSVVVEKPARETSILYTESSLGNGVLENISDIIYVDPDLFDKMRTVEMVKEIEHLNTQMLNSDKHYVLIGPGRWGTRDRFLGIPVTWSQISNASVIVEISLPNFPLDSSLGSHFFHNVTSMNIGYLSIQNSSLIDFINWENISKQKIVNQTTFFKHISFEKPLTIRMNGKERRAVIEMNT